MATTNFSTGTLIQPTWLNEVDEFVFSRADRLTPNLDQFGATSGVTSTSALQSFFSYLVSSGQPGRLPPGNWICSSKISLPNGTLDLEIMPGATLDLSGATISNGDCALELGTAATQFTTLPGLANDALVNGNTVVFSSAPGLVEGDLFIIYNTTTGSFNPVRTYYRAGDYLRVKSISGNTVTTDKALFDTYLTTDTLSILKVIPNKIKISGGGTIKFPTVNTASGLRVYNAYRSSIKDITCTGAQRAQLELYHGYETTFTNIKSYEYLANVNLNYNISFLSCFDCHVYDSNIHSTRHAVTFTTGEITASIPTRLCTVKNTTASGELFALDQHGNCEHCSFIGNTIYGGVHAGGNHSLISNNKIWSIRSEVSSDYIGTAYRIREAYGANHEFSDNEIMCLDSTVATPSDAGAVLLMVLGNPARAGTLRMHNNRIVSSNVAQTVVANIEIAGANEDNISCVIDGFYYVRSAGAAANIQITGNAVGAFREIDIRNVEGASIRGRDLRFRYCSIEHVNCRQAINDGIFLEILQYTGQQQIARITGSMVLESNNGGIVIVGPGKTEDTIMILDGNTSFNNAQDNTTTSTSKSSINASDLKVLTMTDNKVGDTQGVATQLTSVNIRNIDKWTDVDNQQITSALSKSTSGITTTITTIPAL